MAGFDNEVMYASNVDFTGAFPVGGTVTADGQILIGSTSSPNIRVGTLTSVDTSVSITTGPGTIDLSAGSAIPSLFVTDGGNATPASNAITIAGGNGLTTSGSGSTVTVDLDAPVSVANGGTGKTSLTSNGVLMGAGSGAITAETGTVGRLLVAQAAGNPIFSNQAAGDFFFTSSGGGIDRVLTVRNTSNTAGSGGTLLVQSAGSSAGDPKVQYGVSGVTTWTQGIDNDSSDNYVLAASSALGTTDVMQASTAGEINYPLQPSFLAYLGSDVLNVTGNGGTYQLGSGTALTEVFDQNSDFVTSGTFTAPVTGRYYLYGKVMVEGNTTLVFVVAEAITSNRTYQNTFERFGSSVNLSCDVACIADMDAADTCTWEFTGGGESGDTSDIAGGAVLYSYCCGQLIA